MTFDYDSRSPVYVEPKARFQLLSKEYDKPSDLASACQANLESMDAEVSARLEAVFSAAADALGLSVVEARQLAMQKMREEWQLEELARIERLEEPRWYRVRNGGKTDIFSYVPPDGTPGDIDGPIPFPHSGSESLRASLEERAAKVEWSDRDLAGAFTRNLFESLFKDRKTWPPNEEYERYNQAFRYSNLFRHEAHKMIDFGSILEKKEHDQSDKPTRKTRFKRSDYRIPFYEEEDELRNIIEALGNEGFLEPSQVTNMVSEIFPHFYVEGIREKIIGPNEIFTKIAWRGTIVELAAFFDQLLVYGYMNEGEARYKPSFIESHFTVDGREVKRTSVSMSIKLETNKGNIKKARSLMASLF